MDRNFVARKQFEEQQRLKAHNKSLREAMQAGQIPVVDRIGQAIEVGALIIWHPPFDLVFEVKEITPIMDPNVRPGAVRLIVECRTDMSLLAGQPQMGMIRIGTQRAPGHAELDPVVGAPAEEETTPPVEDSVENEPEAV